MTTYKSVIIMILFSSLLYANNSIEKKSLEYNSTLGAQDKLINSINDKIEEEAQEKALKKLKNMTPAIYMKKGDKVIAFFESKAFNNTPYLKNISILNNTTVGSIVMVVTENGKSIYSTLKGDIRYIDILQILKDSSSKLINEIFKKGLVSIVPPPSNLFIIASIGGEILISYIVNKYIELDKRGYVGLEDMLWNVPDEIKNKITVLNLEDTKRETIFDFGDVDKDTILDDEVDGDTAFDRDIKKETIFDY